MSDMRERLARAMFDAELGPLGRYWHEDEAAGLVGRWYKLAEAAMREVEAVKGSLYRHFCDKGHERIGLLDKDGPDDGCPLCNAEVRCAKLEEEVDRLRKNIRERQCVDMTPDTGMVSRILSAYIDEITVTDNLLWLPPENPLCVAMNEARDKRNALLRAALAAAKEGKK